MATLANGLTDSDQRYCFEIANVIWNDITTATIHNGYGIQLSITDLGTLQSDLATKLAALSAASVTIVQGLIAEWMDVRTGELEMANGGSNTVQGLNLSLEGQRNSIKRLFAAYVPVMQMATAQAHKQDTVRGESDIIGIMRG